MDTIEAMPVVEGSWIYEATNLDSEEFQKLLGLLSEEEQTAVLAARIDLFLAKN